MKKVLVAIICFLCIPIVTLAADYDINHFYIDATLKDNGDMDVSELIVLDGTFNGYERDIVYEGNYTNYNGSNIENLSVSAKYVNNVSLDTFNESFDVFNEVYSANNGDMGKYILSDLSNGIRLRMYYSTDNESTAFLIKYTLKDVGIAHNDVIEYYWNFIGDGFEDDIRDLQIRVNYPSKMNKDDFSWWFHGPLTGNSDIVDANTTYTSVLASVKKVSAYEAVDFRTIVPKAGFNDLLFKKYDNENVKESIIEHEDDIVAKDLETIKRNRTLFYTFEALSVIYYVVLVIIWAYVHKKYDKERKPKFNLEYNREFIDDYNVEVIDYLMNSNITPNAMSASIMNLIYKKNIKAEKIVDEKNGYKFTLLNRDNLNETENYLVDFLFNRVGTNNEFTTKDLKKYAKSTQTCDKFMSSYTKWKNKVIEDGKNQGFFDKLPGRYGYGFFMLLLAFLIYFFGTIVFHVEFFLIHTLIFVAIIFIVYIGTIKRKSEKGIEDYTKWKAFKKFLNDFGTFNTKELPEIILWERYLVYATIFGLADKVEKAMNVKIKELELNDMYSDNYVFINNYDLTTSINHSINQAYQGAQATITRESASASGGSFGGHGGGFSSGGGFGGGGGGGRGF